ncbi:MAG: hypothetical protein P0S93_05375 [Candidatus Neptunochlamydia sp.]|nr:hypothetical protein [Candidatus Neptunochlamydia sp.]
MPLKLWAGFENQKYIELFIGDLALISNFLQSVLSSEQETLGDTKDQKCSIQCSADD